MTSDLRDPAFYDTRYAATRSACGPVARIHEDPRDPIHIRVMPCRICSLSLAGSRRAYEMYTYLAVWGKHLPESFVPPRDELVSTPFFSIATLAPRSPPRRLPVSLRSTPPPARAFLSSRTPSHSHLPITHLRHLHKSTVCLLVAGQGGALPACNCLFGSVKSSHESQ